MVRTSHLTENVAKTKTLPSRELAPTTHRTEPSPLYAKGQIHFTEISYLLMDINWKSLVYCSWKNNTDS